MPGLISKDMNPAAYGALAAALPVRVLDIPRFLVDFPSRDYRGCVYSWYMKNKFSGIYFGGPEDANLSAFLLWSAQFTDRWPASF